MTGTSSRHPAALTAWRARGAGPKSVFGAGTRPPRGQGSWRFGRAGSRGPGEWMAWRLSCRSVPPGLHLGSCVMNAVFVEQRKVRIRIERLRSENARSVPRPGREQLHGNDRVEARLPRDGPQAELLPARLRIGHLIEVHLARLTVLATDHPGPDDRAADHPVADLRGIGSDRREHVARRNFDPLDADAIGAI